jgi:hypothetical protein
LIVSDPAANAPSGLPNPMASDAAAVVLTKSRLVTDVCVLSFMSFLR